MPSRVVIVGGGRMGTALVGGLLASGWRASDLAVVETVASQRALLSRRFDSLAVLEVPETAEFAVLAVKPDDVPSACKALAEAGVKRLLSIAAGVSTSSLESWLGRAVEVVRAMPNSPAVVRAGISAISRGTNASDETMAWAEKVLGAVGTVVRVPEEWLDTVTALSGSGPAYLFLLAEALIDAGIRGGLSGETSRLLTVETLLGSSRLLAESGESPAQLRAAVSSPGGTTEAALAVLQLRQVRKAFIDAVAAAASKSAELGSARPGRHSRS